MQKQYFRFSPYFYTRANPIELRNCIQGLRRLLPNSHKFLDYTIYKICVTREGNQVLDRGQGTNV
jgi:hypothetical protein